MLNRIDLLAGVLQALDTELAGDKAEHFVYLFRYGCDVLGYDADHMARAFDTSIPHVRRWRNGVIPPAARMVLAHLRDDVAAEMRRLEARLGETHE